VNVLFEASKEADVSLARGLAVDLHCMFFQVGGMFVVTLRVVSAVVAAIITLSTWLNWTQ
jgi:hypothetical protein